MEPASDRANESACLAALRELDVLDSEPEAEFDALVHVAAVACEVPIALLSLTDAGRQWFKASIGLPGTTEVPRQLAFCAHAVLDEALFEVADATLDPRFADNPLVAGPPWIRFYAGAPIQLGGGARIGTLCVMDRRPRRLTEAQQQVLGQLSVAVARALEGRRARRDQFQAKAEARRASLLLRHSAEAVVGISPGGQIESWNPAASRLFGYSAAEVIGQTTALLLPPELSEPPLELRRRLDRAQAQTQTYEAVRRRSDGGLVVVAVTLVPERDARNELTGFTKFMRDIGQRHRAQSAQVPGDVGIGLVADHVPSMMAYWSVELHCRYANPAYESWFGVKPDALVGLHISQLLGPELYALNRPYLEAALAGEQQTFEREVPGPDGRVRHSLAFYVPDLVDGEVVGLLVQVTDVTRLKQVEASLRRQIGERERDNALLQAGAAALEEAQRLGHLGSWEWLIEPDLTSWSPELYRIMGRDPHRPPPSYAEHAALYAPASWEILRSAVERAVAAGEPYVVELEFIGKDDLHGWLEARGEAVRNEQGRIVGLRGTVHDITRQRQLSENLAEQHELLRVTLQSIGDAVLTSDAKGEVLWLNPAAERMTGWQSGEAAGKPVLDVFCIVDELTRQPAENAVLACLAQGANWKPSRNTLLIARDGREFGIEESAAPIRNESGLLLGAVLVLRDVSEQRRMSGEMTYRATHDSLTGLVNRSEFESRLERLLRQSHEEHSEHALLYIDLDQFKLVNDASGHAVGDQLLRQVSTLLGESVRSRDTLARLGGDEFAVILEHCTSEQAMRVAQQVCERLDDFRFSHDSRRFRIGASIGLVPVDGRWPSTSAIMQAADTACYAAKEAGRNRVHAWRDSDSAIHSRQGDMQWATRIEQALDDDGFVLFAQRIHPLHAPARGLHAEVLLRMVGADGRLVGPGAFLPAAERFNLASRLDRWVLRHAVEWMRSLPSLSLIDNLSVNLSGQSVGDRSFHRWAFELLGQAGEALCRRLCLEVTETAAVTNLADAAEFIDQVRSAGVRVALDDFGSGASSFGYLKRLQVDYLKIDGQFIRELTTDPLDDAAVRCFAEVARVIGVKTIAEFVDAPEVLARLREIGIDYAQGFLLHRPAPIAELAAAANSAGMPRGSAAELAEISARIP